MSFWCFVFLSRCLIYKVHASTSRSSARLFYHTQFRLSRTFFRLFRDFSAPGTAFLQVLSSNRRFRANSFSLAHPSSLVNTFFQNRSCFPPLCPIFQVPPREALRYNTNSRPFCQHLFSLFRRFFRRHLFLIQNSGCALLLNVIGYLI